MNAKLFSTLAAVLFSAVVSAPAQAVIHLPGTFVPVYCGAAQAGFAPSPVQQVCFGSITEVTDGSPLSAVEFVFEDGTERVYRVTQMSHYLNALSSGETHAKIHMVDASGNPLTMKVVRAASGEVLSASGTLEIMDYTIPAFESVFTAQSF